MKTRWLTSGLLALILFTGIAQADGLGAGDRLDSLASYGLEGMLPDTTGKVVLIDFWASWCGPCKISFPYLDTLYRELAPKGFELVAVSQDDKVPAMKKFLAANPVTFPVVRDGQHKLASAVRPEGMPTSLILDKRGIIRHVHKGFHGEKTAAQLREWIKELLAE